MAMDQQYTDALRELEQVKAELAEERRGDAALRDVLERVKVERDAATDYAHDQALVMGMVAKALGVPNEPHQGRAERILEAAEQKAKTASLAERFAKAKGRHHSQHAMCDLLEHFGMPCVRPGEDAEMVTCDCGDQFPPDSYGAGFMDANGGVCESCAAAAC